MKRILNILSYVGIALVFGALAVRFLRPEWDQYAIYATWAGLALVILYTIGQWREIATYFGSRNARYGAMTGVSVLAALGILIAVNYISARQNKRWDLTSNKQYTLSEQTQKLLRELRSPVRLLVFDQEQNFERFRARLAGYEYESSQLDVEYIDADRRPVQTKEYEIQQYGTIVVEYMGRRERITADTEQDITNAIIKVLNPTKRKVYFLSGHGEKDTANSERAGYSGIADALKRDNYEFDKVVLAQTNEIPEDATIVAIAGPTGDLLEQEVTLLREYLNSRAGKLLVMLDPALDSPQPNLTALLKEFGINATNSVVVDVSGRTQVATIPVAGPPYPAHAITERFEFITMFPMARAITPATDAAPERAPQSFVQTAAQSWAETNMGSLEKPDSLAPEPDQGDIAGPVSVAVAMRVPPADQPPPADPAQPPDPQVSKPETRVVAIGDSEFAANAYLGIEGNRDLFMNTVNWLAQQENLIAIRPRDPADRRLTLTANHMNGIFWLSIVVIPALVIGTGVLTLWRRRSV